MSRCSLRAPLLALLVAAASSGCGGGDPPSHQFVYRLQNFREIASVRELQAKLSELQIEHLQYMCGYSDGARTPDGAFLWHDGRSPRWVLLTVFGEDIEKLMSWNSLRLESNPRNVQSILSDNTPPFPCDPLDAALNTRFGGVG